MQSEEYLENEKIQKLIFKFSILCIQKVSSIFLQFISSQLKAAILSVIRDVICFVPLAIYLPFGMGIMGVLWAAPISDGIIICTIILLILEFRNMKKNLEAKNTNSIM